MKVFSRDSTTSQGINWSDYAPQMDLMAELMPSYEENLAALREHIHKRGLAGRVRIADLGAGTGIFSQAIAEMLPDAEIVHVDSDPAMNEVAKTKYQRAGLTNIEIVPEHLQRLSFPLGSFDLIVCVNVLYAVPPQQILAAKIRSWLRPDGSLFIIDFGRKQSAIDWGLHFLGNALRGRNTRKYFRFLLFGQQITLQALKGRKSQELGKYWMHSTQEFGDFLVQSGFSLDELRPCHRGYADLAICRLNHSVGNDPQVSKESPT
jgi:2-polyprenyl-3-methyl-5-hydroxy-6-metoxy-1,4-benzoquinol methylase